MTDRRAGRIREPGQVRLCSRRPLMSDSSRTNDRSPPLDRVRCAAEAGFGLVTLSAGGGLRVNALPNGSLYSIECSEVLINQVLASPVARGIGRIYLRVLD